MHIDAHLTFNEVLQRHVLGSQRVPEDIFKKGLLTHAQVIVELQERGASPEAVKQTLSSSLALAPSQVGPPSHFWVPELPLVRGRIPMDRQCFVARRIP